MAAVSVMPDPVPDPVPLAAPVAEPLPLPLPLGDAMSLPLTGWRSEGDVEPEGLEDGDGDAEGAGDVPDDDDGEVAPGRV